MTIEISGIEVTILITFLVCFLAIRRILSIFTKDSYPYEKADKFPEVHQKAAIQVNSLVKRLNYLNEHVPFIHCWLIALPVYAIFLLVLYKPLLDLVNPVLGDADGLIIFLFTFLAVYSLSLLYSVKYYYTPRKEKLLKELSRVFSLDFQTTLKSIDQDLTKHAREYFKEARCLD